jgi:hypothetical protein
MASKEGFWLVEYRTQFGEGIGVIVLDTGEVIGGDNAGGTWDGNYGVDENGKLMANFTVNLPPNVFSTVTGHCSPSGFSESYSVELPKTMGDPRTYQLKTGLGVIDVTFKKVRDFPN